MPVQLRRATTLRCDAPSLTEKRGHCRPIHRPSPARRRHKSRAGANPARSCARLSPETPQCRAAAAQKTGKGYAAMRAHSVTQYPLITHSLMPLEHFLIFNIIGALQLEFRIDAV